MMDRNRDKEWKFAVAISRLDYEDAERILKETGLCKDKKAFIDLLVYIAWSVDDAFDDLFSHSLYCWTNILGLSLIGFLHYLEEREWPKASIYDCYLRLTDGPLCHMEGASELGFYYYFKLIDEDDCASNLYHIAMFHNDTCSIADDKTVVYAARKAMKEKLSGYVEIWALYATKELGAKIGEVDFSETRFAAPYGMADITGVAVTCEAFKDLVCDVKFAAAAAMLAHPGLDEQTRQDWLLKAIVWDYDSGDLGMIGFLAYLLDKGWNKAQVYRWFVLVTEHSADFFGVGVYGLALYYCRKLVAEEETLENLRLLLSFTDVPGDFMGRDEAEDVARRILALDANDAKARDVLELVGGAD